MLRMQVTLPGLTLKEVIAFWQTFLKEPKREYAYVFEVLSSLPGGSKICEALEYETMCIGALRILSIYNSMTSRERKSPKLVDASRQKRIAAGSGISASDVRTTIDGFVLVVDFNRS